MTLMLQDIQSHWTAIRPFMTIHNEQDYDRVVAQMNDLLDEVGTNESHPLYEFLDTLGTLLHVYEERHFPMPQATGAEVLQYLMAEHGLRQSDLSEIGSQGVVSEILNGKRELNVRQIRKLADRFQVSPAVFV
ncbi:MAG: helix-turn-helix domain-containing protein [Anaerolineae bacterium]|nr:helix-turn-helix domain-containing protein [Anaerolineae bacterium]